MAARWSPVLDTENAFAGWADEELFRAWVSRAVAISRRQAALDADRTPAGFAAQRAAVRELVEAVNNAYRALDVPAPADPEVTAALLGAVNQGDSFVEGEPPIGGAWVRDLFRWFFMPGSIEVARCWIDWRGVAHTDPMTRDPVAYTAPGNRNEWVAMMGARASYDWSYAVVGRECAARPGIDCVDWINRVVPPALWEFWLWSSLAARLADRSGWQVIRDARDWSFVRNVRVMASFNVQGVGRDVSNLIGAAEEQAQAARDGSPLGKISRGMQALGAPLLGFPPVGTALGIFLEGLGTLIDFVGPAVQVNLDGWGRRQPAFSPWRISGGSGAENQPTHDVAEPPGFVRAPRGSLRVLLPRDVPSARVRVDGGELRAAIWDGELLAGSHLVEVTADGRTPIGHTAVVRVGERTDWNPPALVRPAERRDTSPDFTTAGGGSAGGNGAMEELEKLIRKGDERREAIGLPRRTEAQREALLKGSDGSRDVLVAAMASSDQADLAAGLDSSSGGGSSGSSGGGTGGGAGGGAGDSSSGGTGGAATAAPGVLRIEGAEGVTLPPGTLAGVWATSGGAGAPVEVATVRDFGPVPVRLSLPPGNYLVRWRFGSVDGEALVAVTAAGTTTAALRPPRGGRFRWALELAGATLVSVGVWKGAEALIARSRRAGAAAPPAPAPAGLPPSDR